MILRIAAEIKQNRAFFFYEEECKLVGLDKYHELSAFPIWLSNYLHVASNAYRDSTTLGE